MLRFTTNFIFFRSMIDDCFHDTHSLRTIFSYLTIIPEQEIKFVSSVCINICNCTYKARQAVNLLLLTAVADRSDVQLYYVPTRVRLLSSTSWTFQNRNIHWLLRRYSISRRHSRLHLWPSKFAFQIQWLCQYIEIADAGSDFSPTLSSNRNFNLAVEVTSSSNGT